MRTDSIISTAALISRVRADTIYCNNVQGVLSYIKTNLVHATATYTVAAKDAFVCAGTNDSTPYALKVNLPALASSHGMVMIIKLIADSAIVIDPNSSETIDRVTYDTISTLNAAVQIIGDTVGTDTWRKF